MAQQALALAVKGPGPEDIEERRALLKASEARLALARELLKDTELYAPAASVTRTTCWNPATWCLRRSPC